MGNLSISQQLSDYPDALPQSGYWLLKHQPVFRLHLDFVAGSQAQHKPTLREVVYRGSCHGDGGGATNKHTGDASLQQDVPGLEGASRQNRELVAPVSFGHPSRLMPLNIQ